MSKAPRRIAGAALALAGSAALFVGQGLVQRTRDRTVRGALTQAATAKSAKAADWLKKLLTDMEGRASTGASLTQIVGPASQGLPAVPTLQDEFRLEPYWETYRQDFSVQGVSFGGDRLDAVKAVEGLDATKLDFAPLISAVRRRHVASLFLRTGTQDWPYAAAGAEIFTPNQPHPVLVLAKSIDSALVRQMANDLAGAVVISDGVRALLSAPGELGAKELPAQAAQPLVIAPDFAWAASSETLLPGLTLWAIAPLGTLAKDADADAATSTLILRLVTGFLGLIGALLLLWPSGDPASQEAPGGDGETDGPDDSGSTLPSGVLITPPANASTLTTPRSGSSDPRLIRSGNSDPRLRKPASTGLTPAEAEGITALQEIQPLGSNVFGRYVLLDLLGEGGMAEVYTAVTYGAERFRRSFVIKRLRAEMLRNQAVVSSFIDEANLASSLVHSNILPVFDFGKIGDEYYMATEYILGRDLGKLSRQSFEEDEAPLPMALVFFAAHQTLEALDYAHQKKADDGAPLGIVHRDISPNNILISARGEVKLFDFGIAKAEGRVTQTVFGTVKGNVRFMSPEQARGEPVDSRSDLFAVGLVIYYVLTGDTFYSADTNYALLVKAAHGPGEAELANLAKLPKEAQRILERALRIDPNERFQTAAEFATALQPYIAGQQAALGRTMERLFAEELREEQARFAAAAAAVGDAEKAEADPARDLSKS